MVFQDRRIGIDPRSPIRGTELYPAPSEPVRPARIFESDPRMSEFTARETAATMLDEPPDFCTREEWAEACEMEADEWASRAARRGNLDTARYLEAVRLWIIRIASH